MRQEWNSSLGNNAFHKAQRELGAGKREHDGKDDERYGGIGTAYPEQLEEGEMPKVQSKRAFAKSYERLCSKGACQRKAVVQNAGKEKEGEYCGECHAPSVQKWRHGGTKGHYEEQA